MDVLPTITPAARTVVDDTTVAAMVNTLGGATSTGTGGLVRINDAVLVAPALGTPASGNLANCTGYPASGIGGTFGATANTIGIRGADATTVAAGGGTLTAAGAAVFSSVAIGTTLVDLVTIGTAVAGSTVGSANARFSYAADAANYTNSIKNLFSGDPAAHCMEIALTCAGVTVNGLRLFGDGNAVFGVNSGVATATPLHVSFGGTYGTNTAGTPGNLKWYMYFDGGTNYYGIGMSSGKMEYQAGSGGGHEFYVNQGASALSISSAGAVDAPVSLKVGGGTAITKILSATATLNFGSIVAGAFEDLTITVTGAVDDGTCSATVTPPNASIIADIIYTAWISAANTVTVRASNNSLLTTRDPASGTFRATVIKF